MGSAHEAGPGEGPVRASKMPGENLASEHQRDEDQPPRRDKRIKNRPMRRGEDLFPTKSVRVIAEGVVKSSCVSVTKYSQKSNLDCNQAGSRAPNEED